MTLTPSSAVTDTNGMVTAVLGAASAHTINVTAAYAGQTQQIEVSFTGGNVSLTLSATPGTAPADNASLIELTASVEDATGSPIAGQAVAFSSASPSATLAVTQGTTDAAGVAKATLKSGTAQSVAVQGAVPGAVGTTDVSFTPYYTMAMSASSATGTADGVNPVIYMIAVGDYAGNALAGVAVTFISSVPDVTLSPVSGMTNSNGQLSTAVTTTQARSISVTASTISPTIAASSVSFLPGAPARVTLTASPTSLTASNATTSPTSLAASNVAASTLTLTAYDSRGNAVPDAKVTFSATGSSADIGPSSGTTNASGTLTATLSSSVAQVLTATGNVRGRIASANITFNSGAPSAGTSALTATPAGVSADGSSFVTVRVAMVDAFGNPVPNVAVSFAASASNNLFSSLSGITDASGTAVVTLKSTTAETKTITAAGAGIAISATARFTSTAPSQGTINVWPTSLTTTATGGNATFTAGLNSAPASVVTFSLVATHPGVTVMPTSFTFTPSIWATPVAVVLTGSSVGQYGGSTSITIVDSAVSSDARFNGLSMPNVSVTNRNSAVPVVQPLYSQGAMWNTWVENNGSSTITADNTPCAGGEACVHGGEYRYVALPDLDNCTDIVAADALDVFNWSCDTGAGYVRIISEGLRKWGRPAAKFLWVEGTFNGNGTTGLGIGWDNVAQGTSRNASFLQFNAVTTPMALSLVSCSRVNILNRRSGSNLRGRQYVGYGIERLRRIDTRATGTEIHNVAAAHLKHDAQAPT